MSHEAGIAQWAGTQIQARDYYYFYKGVAETLAQERAQLKELGHVTEPLLFNFGVGTRFGNAMGEKWPMKPVHLIELANEVHRYYQIKADIEKDANGDPHPTHPNGAILLIPELEYLETLFAVTAYRAYGGDTIHKWMKPPEEHHKEAKGSLLAKLLGESPKVDES